MIRPEGDKMPLSPCVENDGLMRLRLPDRDRRVQLVDGCPNFVLSVGNLTTVWIRRW